jgi:uncharacterized membrane protein YdjX (TVP38/TMEM64 family)
LNLKNQKDFVVLKIVVVIGLLSSLILTYMLSPQFFSKLWILVTSGDVEAILATFRSYGPWAVVVSIVLNVLINILGFLPSIFFSTANGILFGVVPGIMVSWMSECIGVIISFVLMRSLLRDYAEKMIGKSVYLQKIDEFSGQNGFKMMLFARMLPYLPSGIVTALGALSRIRFHDYVTATLLGKLPSTALEVVVGYDIVNYERNLARLGIVVVIATLFYGGLWWHQQSKKSKPEV